MFVVHFKSMELKGNVTIVDKCIDEVTKKKIEGGSFPTRAKEFKGIVIYIAWHDAIVTPTCFSFVEDIETI